MFLLLGVLACGSASRSHVLTLFGNKTFLKRANHFASHARSTGEHIRSLDEHVTDSCRFYRDASLNGDDDDQDLGPERSLLTFYVGHGRFDGFDAYENGEIRLDEIQLGDGRLRYWWMASCQTMAHGPHPFNAPYEFDPQKGSRNVFRRWAGNYSHESSPPTTPIAPGLRLACGGSTPLKTPTFETLLELWEDLVTGARPSDAFISAQTWDDSVPPRRRVPLCITRGGSLPEATPLYDTTFEEQPNTPGPEGFAYIQYPVFEPRPVDHQLDKRLRNLASADCADEMALSGAYRPPPDRAPVLQLAPMPVVPKLVTALFDEGSPENLGFRKLSAARALEVLGEEEAMDAAAGFDAYFHPCSGQLVLRGPGTGSKKLEGLPEPSEVTVRDLHPKESEVLRLFRGVDGRNSGSTCVNPRLATPPILVDQYIDRAPRKIVEGGGTRNDLTRYLKTRTAEAKLGVRVDGVDYPVLGESSKVQIEVGGHGALLAASLMARKVTGCRNDPSCAGDEAVLSLDKAEARAEAEAYAYGFWSERSGAEAEPRSLGIRFKRRDPAWGYLEAPASCFQREMGITFRFTFEAVGRDDVLPLVVDIPGQDVEPPICYGDPEWKDACGLPPD